MTNGTYEGLKVRCQITDANQKTVISKTAVMSFAAPLGITKQPENAESEGYGKAVTVKVEATGKGLTYNWQYQWKNGNEWKNFGNGNGQSVLSVPMTNGTYEGLKVRCQITDANQKTVTSEVTVMSFSKTYKATFDANGGYFVKEDGSHTAIISQEPDAELGKLTFSHVPENDDPHLMFAGWYTNKECSGKQVSDYRLFIDKNVSFYAKWKACYTITFDANNGYFNGDVNETQFASKAVKGTTFYCLDRYETIQRDSESDAGVWSCTDWTFDPEGKQVVNMYSLAEEVTSDLTVYAQWSYKEQYKVTFDAGEGYFSDGSHTLSRGILKNSETYYPWIEEPEIDDNTRMFDGWYTEKNGKGERISLGQDMLNGHSTVYANWKPAIVITYDANGGKIGSDSIRSIKCAVGKSASEYYFGAERIGYTWTGWYFDKECTKESSYSIKLQENTTVYAGWIKEDTEYHTVVLDANGGYFKKEYYYSVQSPETTKRELVVPDVVYAYTPVSKDGVSAFDGWYLDKECTKKAEYLDEHNIKITKNVTLYAKWVPGYVVTFDGNGIDFDLHYHHTTGYNIEKIYYPSVSVVVKPGEKVTDDEVYVAGTVGYALEGWYQDPECTKPVDFNKPITSDVTYYASWHGYTQITYDSNSEHKFSNGELTMTNTVTKGVEIVPDLSYVDITGRYKVEGWYWDKECTQPVGDSFVTDKAVHLYAKWKTVNIVTFDANGGDFTDGKTTKIYSVEDGKTIGDFDFMAPENWLSYSERRTFKGWSTEPNGTDIISSDEIATYVINEDRVYYAVWELHYAVTFNANGGYFWYEDMTTTTSWYSFGCLLGDGYPWPSNKDEHFEFDGWYLEPECINEVNEEEYIVKNDITLYAKWKKLCIITFDANGGYLWDDESSTTYEQKYDIGALVSGYPWATINDDHKKFDGWCLEPECINEINVDEYVAESDVTLYVKWKDCNLVTFDANGGYFMDDESWITFSKKYDIGSAIGMDGYPWPSINDEHKEFDGWYLEPECVNEVNVEEYIVESDVTLYAKWKYLYIITFDGNGGFIYGNESLPQYQVKVVAGETIPYNPNVERADEHLVFAGWYLEPECINQVEYMYQYIPSEDMTFYAKWEDCYIVTFDGNGGYIYGNSDRPQYQVKVGVGKAILQRPFVENPDDKKIYTRRRYNTLLKVG